MPPLSLASSVTASEPLRRPPASSPEASTEAAGFVGSLSTTRAPEIRFPIAPPPAVVQAVFFEPLKQPTTICSDVALPV